MELHLEAVFLAQELLRNETKLVAVLIKMKEQNKFLELGYRGVYEYVLIALKLSESQSYYFKTVVEKALLVPRFEQAVTSGEITLSQARRIQTVVTESSCEDWIEKVSTLSQRELEKEVTKVNPRAKIKEGSKLVAPELIQLTLAVTPEVEALSKQVKDLESQRSKSDATWNDALQAMAKLYLSKKDPVEKAKRISSGKKKPIVQRPGRHPVQAQVEHEVNLRDSFQCTAINPNGKRCEQKRWLEKDHIQQVHQGGLNTTDNLRTLCSFHHKLRHHAETGTLYSKSRKQAGDRPRV